jgi:hypothetical protein
LDSNDITYINTNGTEPYGYYSWSATSGAYPPGLSLYTTLSANPQFSGTPTAAGTYTFALHVNDNLTSQSLDKTFTITIIAAAPAISTSSLPAAIAGAAYAATLAATGGNGGNSWSVLSGSWPPGLALASSGAITGSPSTQGTYNFTVKVTDQYAQTATAALAITVNPPISITTTSIPGGLTGSPYSTTVAATGGSGSYSGWAITAGSLPPGVTTGSTAANPLNLTGTPTTPGTYNFTWRNCDAVTAQCASQALTITIAAGLSVATPSLPNASFNAGYSQGLSASGGTPGYSWAIIAGSLPAGLSLAGATISGTPSAVGNFSITVQVTDTTLPTPQSATKALTLHVNALPSVGVDSTEIFWGGGGAQAAGTSTAYYGSTPQVFGAAYPFSAFAAGPDATIATVQVLLDGTLIATPTYGTASRADGCSALGGPGWTGCPTIGFTYNFPASSYSLGAHTLAFRATDTNGLAGTASFPITIISTLSITTAAYPNGLVSSAYSQATAATGGTPPYSWALASGTLPPGLSLNASGTISGTATTQGTYNFTLRVTDSATPTPQNTTKALSISISSPLSITTASLPNGLATTAYSQTLASSGGTPGYSWSLTTGALPTGLSLNSSGNIFGTPTTTGTFNFTVKTTDATSPTPQTATQALSITIGAALSITTISLPNGLATTAYSQTLAATGGTPAYVWTLNTGILPTGLTLNAAGTISGSPSTAGTFNFAVKATDSTSPTPQTATQALSITIGPALTITTSSLPNGPATGAYSQALTATGGTGPYTWSLASGTLPPGLTLSSTGLISGTPTTAGLYNFTPQTTDSTAPTAQTTTRALSITIGVALSITTASLPNGLATTAYSQALAATGGTPAYTWSLASGSLPPSLTLSAAGLISGTPTAAGLYNFTAGVSDGTSPTPQAATKALSITIGAALNITTASLPNALATATYSQALAASGGTAAYTWSLASGTLPAGLSLSAAGTISGTPLASGSSTFTIKAIDTTAPTPQIATQLLTLTTNPALSIVTTTLPNALAATPYSQPLVGNGGTPPYTWSVNSGSLPPGLALSSGGTISGTPTTAATYNFTIKGSDSTPSTQSSIQALSIVVGAALNISTSSLPNALATTAYSQPLTVTGGTTPYTWSLTSGALPPGLSLTPSGSIYGTPSVPGAYSFTVQLADNTTPSPQTLIKPLSITVQPELTITTVSLPTGMVSSAYSQSLTATGGTPAYTWTIASGTLPPGLTLSAAGTISGTPTTAGLTSFVAKVTDTTTPSVQTATQALSINLLANVSITTASLPNGLATTPYSQPLAATGGTPGYTWSVASGTLPTGISLTPAGTLAGTPTTPGTYNSTIKVTDTTTPTSLTATQAFSITIGPALTVTTSSLPNGLAGSSYAQILAATGGNPPYTWTIITGTLPAGLSITPGGGISGIPTAAGTFPLTVQATDSTTPSSQTATKNLTLILAAGLSITTVSLPTGLATTPYSQTLSATGGTTPYTWTVASGSLPIGTTLSAAGLLSGTPTTANTFAFVVKATDTTNPTMQSTAQALSITINPALSITTPSLAAGMVGQSYSQLVEATGGTTPYAWSISSGTLPLGLSLSGSTISGTPTTAGTIAFTLQATDTTNPTAQIATSNLSIAVGAAFQITTSSPLPPGLGGNPYSTKIQAGGGTPPYTFTLASGAPPAGLSLQSDGTLSGIPTSAGSYLFSVLASDSTVPTPQTQIKPLAISITPPLSITTTSLPNGLVATPYARTVQATGGTTPYSWTITSGTLPQGLTFSTDGSLIGTPTEAGAFLIGAQVTDTSPSPQTATQVLSLTIGDQLAITTSSLPPAVFGVTYNTPLSAIGGTAPYKWTLISGTLPPGLSLSLAGYIVGTCTGSGVFTITVQAADNTSPVPQKAIRVLTVDSNTSLSITSGPLPPAQVGQPYNTSVSAAGGVPPYTWSLAAGQFPPGLTLNAAGTISGTPTIAGSTTISFQVADTTGSTTSRSFTLNLAAPLSVTTSTLPPATVGTGYAASLAATGGSTPYIWTVISGNLPAGLTLSTSGFLSGAPNTSGTSLFTVQVSDNTQPTPQTATKALSIALTNPLSLTTTVLPNAIIGTSYSQIMTATGGTPPYAWSLTSGVLPTGLTLDPTAGTVAGTPTATGTALFTIQVTDAGTPNQSLAKTYSIIVVGPLTITTPTLTQGLIGRSYNATLAATGGHTPYTWSIADGALPTGMTFSSAGTISGTPTTSGTSTFTAQVTDNLTPGAQTATHSFTLLIADPLTIDTTTLPSSIINTPYTQPLLASGGSAPYTWSLTTGQLPPGITLATNGSLAGTPTATGTSTFTAKATDSGTPPQTATLRLSITVITALTITTATTANGTINQTYTASLAALGGTPPYAWIVSTGALPAGLSLDAAGSILGTPTTPGDFLFTLQASDNNPTLPQSASRAYSITILAPLTITTTVLSPTLIGVIYTHGLDAIGGTAPYTWSISSGTLPPGLSLAPDGTLSGTPTAPGTADFVVTVSDAATPSQAAVKPLSLTVVSALTITTATLPLTYLNQSLTTALAATGGQTPYVWTIAAGTLPAGITLSADGSISGLPTASGTFPFTAQVTDSSPSPQTATQALALTVLDPLIITTSSLSPASTGTSYYQPLAATGGTTPYTWTIATGQLPAGLSLNSSGTISGIPTTPASSTFTVQLLDTGTPVQAATRQFTISTVGPLSITTAAIASGIVGTPYTQPFAATGGTPPYTWTLAAGQLPAGLALSAAGTISGLPAAPTGALLTIQVTDAAPQGQQTATGQFTLTITDQLIISTVSLRAGLQDNPYTQTLAATGATQPYLWSITTGALPPGLNLSATGLIIGTPTTPGTFAFTVQAADPSTPPHTAIRPLSILIAPPLSITTTSIPNPRQGTAYSQTLAAAGGTPPYLWSIATGVFPPGLTLTADGTLAGSPTTLGTFPFTVQVTDTTAPTPEIATTNFSLQTLITFQITTPTVPPAFVGTAFPLTFLATGGTTPYTWTVTTGTLPPGLNLSSLGAIAGTPTIAGTYSFTIQATDAAAPNRTDTASLTVQVQPALSITTLQLPDTTIGATYAQPLAAAGGTPPYTWTIASGTLPAGLTLTAAGNLAGIAITAGSTTFTIQAIDTTQPTPQRVTRTFTIDVTLDISIATNSLSDGYLTNPYLTQLDALGGLAPYTWSATGLPPGLSLAPGGSLYGTPTDTGTYTIVVTAHDSYTPRHIATKTLALNIRTGLSITTNNLPDAQVNVPYNQATSTLFGTQPYTWHILSGSLPPGLLQRPDGTISGIPTAPGGYTFLVEVTDSSPLQLTATRTFSITVLAGFSITTNSLPGGSPATAYNATLQATGGVLPYTWILATGTLPPGLTLAADGTITGTPSTNGTYSITIQAADSSTPPLTATRLFSIPIGASLLIATTLLPDAKLGSFYRQTLTALNGTQPYYWTLQAAALPPGLILLATGDIVGQPTSPGSVTFTVTVADNAQPPANASQTFSINVTPGFQITTLFLPSGSPTVPYRATLTAVDGTLPYTWNLALGQLPTGLALNTQTGTISGTTTKPGIYDLLIQATDATTPPQTATSQFTLTIDSTLQITTAILPDAETGTPYYQSLTATNGVPPFTWSLASALPPGLTLLPSGELYGVPTTAAIFKITVAVSDASQPTAHASRDLLLLVTRSLTITADTVPAGLTSKPYAAVISALGGTPPYRFSATGALPPGLTLSPIGTVTGTPTAAGTYLVTIQVTDAQPTTQTAQILFVIGPILAITTTALPTASLLTPYFAILKGIGATGAYTWTLTSTPALPGITFLPSIAALVGTPIQAGQYTIQITLTDGTQTAATSFTITIAEPLTISPAPLPPAQQSLPYSTALQATGGIPPYTWSFASGYTLPAGLSLSARGILAGQPTALSGPFSLPLCVTDNAKPQTTRVCGTRTLIIGAAFHITSTSLPTALPGHWFSYQLTATGAQGTLTWTPAFALPTGMSLAEDGTLAGTPTTAGKYDLTIIASDTSNEFAVADLILIVAAPLTIQTTVLPTAIVGTAYAAGIVGISGQPPYLWSGDPATLPTGFALDPSGILYGAPTVPGTTTISITLTDASTPTQRATIALILSVDQPLRITTTNLPPATSNSPYNTALTANGIPPLQWILSSGQLPGHLTLAPDGTIAGTPTTDGSYTFVASVTDAHGQSTAAAFTVSVAPGLNLGPATTLPNATVASPYSYSLHSTFAGPVVWTLVLGSLPPGLTLAPDGTLAGTPTVPGTTSFMLQADGGSQTARQVYSMTVASPTTPPVPTPTIPQSSTLLPAGDVHQPYAAALTAAGGSRPYAWALTQGQLPAGLAISPLGLLSGNASDAGAYSFALTVTDTNNQTASALFTLTIRSPLTITNPNDLLAHVGTAVTLTLTAAGGAPPYIWSTTDPLPVGLTLTSTGVLAGKPTTPASSTLLITVHDSSSLTSPAIATTTLQITVTAGLAIITTALPAPAHELPYTTVLTAAGGATPYTWTLTDGQLPAGLSLSLTGTLSGTATALGTYRFAISVADSTPQTATTSYAITVADPLTITTPGPLSATLASPNTFTLAAAGGTQPYAWSLTTGTLPTGLTFAPNGVISGTPSAASTTTITVSVHDSAQPPATAAVSLTITAAGKLAISTTTLPAGNLTSPYNTPLQASGGASPYTWSLSSGSLPPGLILAADGLLAGTATRPGPYTFAVTVADSSGQQASATFTCSIATIAITTSTLPTGTAGTSYIATTDAIGGLPPYSWSTPSVMPVGLIFTADGVITGTPTGPFTGSITFTATDQANATASRTLLLTITAPDAGTLTLTGLTAQIAPATQATIAATLAKPAPADLTGRLAIQFLPDTPGRDDSTLVFVPANSRTIAFSISKGSTTARFALAPTLQAGTSAGLITVTATVDSSPSSLATSITRVVALAPVITAAHIIAHDAYTLTLQLDGYSTTASVSNAHFTFTGLATQSDFNINVTAIFNAWYSSQAANSQCGNFQYKQNFNFTGDTTNLSSLNATLTNSIGPSAPYTIPVTK